VLDLGYHSLISMADLDLIDNDLMNFVVTMSIASGSPDNSGQSQMVYMSTIFGVYQG